jgi:nucleoid-associated protein YgaU
MSKLARLITVAVAVLFLLACPSAPKPVEPVEPVQPVQESVVAPVLDPEGGSFTEAVTVEIRTTTEGAKIRYTVDGTDPSSTNGTEYTGPVKIEETTTLAAIGYKQDWKDSQVVKATYTVTVAVAPPPVTVEPITDGEVDDVRAAIARAKEADAEYYDPTTIAEAEQLLHDALVVRESDPGTARETLASAKEKADQAFETSKEKAIADLTRRMEALKQLLLDEEADKFVPDDYAEAIAGIEEASALFSAGQFADARARAYDALKEMADLSASLRNRIAWVKILKRDTEQYLQDAEAANANQWAPVEKDRANLLYLRGMEAFQAYGLGDAEESYGAAREAAKDAANLSRERSSTAMKEAKQKAVETRTLAIQAIIEASGLTIVTEDGTVIQPQKWSADDLLKELEEMEQERQQQQESRPPQIPERGTAVLADISEEDLLTQAKELLKLGIIEEGNGNYAKAQEYYREANRYVEIYKSFAVKGVYTVRLIPERRDCLWRIAEYDYIYGNPLLWPLIWKRNKKLIQNPDLIYPGWQLVIPPE